VGLVTGANVPWLVSFCPFYPPREDNFGGAAASANIALAWAAPIAVRVWVQLVSRGRSAWLWIVTRTSPLHAVVALITWGAGPGLAGSSKEGGRSD
jgi:hypothetical protein